MFDIALDENFSVQITDENDLGVVEGRDAFEQSLAVHLTDFLDDEVGVVGSTDALEQRIRLEASRMAERYDEIEGVVNIETGLKPGSADTFEVEIVYDTGDNFTLTLNE